jgi:hypothetical protein
LDNLLGLLSTDSSEYLYHDLEILENEFKNNGVEAVITRLIKKDERNGVPMEINVELEEKASD